ncbi:MAG: hypothetical protein ACOY3P_26810 [Planctomycetota bacterium]
MGSVSRSAQFAKLHKVLKKHYTSVAPDTKRPVLEHLLFACLLEDAHYHAAESAFAAVVHNLFDWNEVRVTSIAELSELMSALPDPRAAANRIKRVLHGVFEATYSFDLEDRRKKSLGLTVKGLEKLDGTTPFSVAYVVQAALGGHQIPVDRGTLSVLQLLGLVSEKDVAAGAVPGLERAVSKSKGIEFGSLLHQLGADFTANPYAPRLREILLEIDPEVGPRLPKRRAPPPPPPEQPAQKASAPKGAKASAAEAAEPPAKGKSKKKALKEEPPVGAPSAKMSTEKGEAARPKPAPPAQPKPGSAKKKGGEKSKAERAASDGPKRKTAVSGLAKKKPR